MVKNSKVLLIVAGLTAIVLNALVFAAPIVPPDFKVQTVVDNANLPAALALAPDGRLFYTENDTGKVRVIKDGKLLDEPFVDVAVNFLGNRGLTGITFHPDFENNGYVYISYDSSSTGDDTSVLTEVTEYRVVRFTANGDVAQPGSETLIYSAVARKNHPGHSNGTLKFGPDGKLYISIGDKRQAGRAGLLDWTNGKILRLNDDGSIPADNPFANDGDPNTLGEVYAYGLRNSYQFTFQPITGRLFAAENGPNAHDEIDIVQAGMDYGWNAVQGFADQPGEQAYASGHANYQDPILDILDTVAPTGIGFTKANRLLFGEFVTGKIRMVTLMKPGVDEILSVADWGTGLGNITDILIVNNNRMYVSNVSQILVVQHSPEPGTLLLFAIGLIGLTGIGYSRRKR